MSCINTYYLSHNTALDQDRLREVGEDVLLPASNNKNSRKAKVINPNTPHALEDGQPIRVEVEGIYKAFDSHRGWEPVRGGRVVSALDDKTELAIFSRYATILKLEPVPKWRPGDVIDIWFGSADKVANLTPYTYVRGHNNWPGDTRKALTDEQINNLWNRGLVNLIRKKSA